MRLEIADTPVSPQHLATRYKEARQRLMGKPIRLNRQRPVEAPREMPLNHGCVGWTFGQYHLASVTRVKFDYSHVTARQVATVVADFFGLTLNDLQSHTRTKDLVYARHIAMYLARKMTPRSLPAIGRTFGGRDHTTVLHACEKIEALLKTDDQLRADVETLRVIFEGV
jgi:hypothetical protein